MQMQMQIQPPRLQSLSQLSSMENHRKNSSSGDSFSFPSTPNQEDSDFEFGSLTPDSPSCTTSPADHLFFNGRLQPHSFPLPHNHHHHPLAATSRTSSISSKDSFLSSRSNSTSSTSSSARTSSSDSSERRLFHHNKVLNTNHRSTASTVSGHHFHQPYGCSRRWQYITPAPALNRDSSKRKTRDTQRGTTKRKSKTKKLKKKKNTVKGVSFRFGRRIFRWLFTACRQCHAMEPSKTHKQNKEKVLQEGKSCKTSAYQKNQLKTQNTLNLK